MVEAIQEKPVFDTGFFYGQNHKIPQSRIPIPISQQNRGLL